MHPHPSSALGVAEEEKDEERKMLKWVVLERPPEFRKRFEVRDPENYVVSFLRRFLLS